MAVYTENGAKAHKSTGNAVLDFFALGGAIDNLPDKEQIKLLNKAYNEDAQLTARAMFYFRDVRGGQGKRNVFRKQLTYLAGVRPAFLANLVHLIPEYGRWDDLYALVGTELEPLAFDLIAKQIIVDLGSERPSLCAKWLKSINASSTETKRLGRLTAKALNLEERDYRKLLTQLRKRINLVETALTEGKTSEIIYSQVPSQAMNKYSKAFYRNDLDRFENYINSVKSGEVKINAGTLYPQQLVHNAMNGVNNVTDVLWENLPDYTEGREENSIAVVDVSGSMWGTPIEVAISLGIFLAERATGV